MTNKEEEERFKKICSTVLGRKLVSASMRIPVRCGGSWFDLELGERIIMGGGKKYTSKEWDAMVKKVNEDHYQESMDEIYAEYGKDKIVAFLKEHNITEWGELTADLGAVVPTPKDLEGV